MPNNFDFSELKNVKTMEVNPQGWINSLIVEYGIYDDIAVYGKPIYYWRVKGTKHTFTIPVMRMDYLSSGNYKKHFEDALEAFREDYLSWKEAGFATDWAREYERQFSKYIII